MALLGNLPIQTSFMCCNSRNLKCLPKPGRLCFTPLHSHMLRPATAKFENQWASIREGENLRDMTRKFEKQWASFTGERETTKSNYLPAILDRRKEVGVQEVGIRREGLNLQPMGEEVLKQKKVAVFWDLDNKPPKVPPFEAAIAVREMAAKFGEIVDMAAYANRHAFTHVPQWIVEERRERKKVDFLETKGVIKPDQPYVCGVCGRKCKTNVDLKKHFRQLHERERQKKLSRMNSLKGKRRAKFKEQFKAKDEKYQNAARNLLVPKVGYGLASELRRAGVYVKTVEDKPQAADAALKRQIEHSMTRGIDYMFLISDDSDFSEMLDQARNNSTRTIVLGDSRVLMRHADLWLSWDHVASGKARDEIDAVVHKWSVEEAVLDEILDMRDTVMDEGYKYDSDESDSDIDQIVDEIVKAKGKWGQPSRASVFSEEEQQWQAEGGIRILEGHFYDEDDDLKSNKVEDVKGEEEPLASSTCKDIWSILDDEG